MLSRQQILDEFKKHPWPFTFVEDALTFADHIAKMARNDAIDDCSKLFENYPVTVGVEIKSIIRSLKYKQHD